MKSLDREVLDEMARRLVLEFDPEQIILFGSRAWGKPTDESDFDLCVSL
ncbi:MAG: nucleotidyltransferase domain-containing protein [Chloroherpetonaceae bacterium]|nr:nucleotidyltransferase domain-containing protein [Chloroherpetonaceae bacterium]MDW8437310.1 nucleotidyltransferase domain-containing protein [Chloroherpetonaceae bacterium]